MVVVGVASAALKALSVEHALPVRGAWMKAEILAVLVVLMVVEVLLYWVGLVVLVLLVL